MSPSPILILPPRMTDDTKAMWKAALDLGWSTQRVQGWRIQDGVISAGRAVVVYGEPLFAEAIADQLGLVLLEPSIDWLVSVPREYRLREVEMMTLAEAREQTGRAFVKPADGKIFDPRVYETGQDLPAADRVDQDILVLRSSIVDFRLEVRCFIHNRRIQTLSPYWRNDALAQDAEGLWSFLPGEEAAARSFANQVLLDPRVPLPPACTLDIGLTSTGEWAIVEANPCWGAGLYGCDPAKVLQALAAAIVRGSEVTVEDRLWVSHRREANGPE